MTGLDVLQKVDSEVVTIPAGDRTLAYIDPIDRERERSFRVAPGESDVRDFARPTPYLLAPVCAHLSVFDALPAARYLVEPVMRQDQVQNQPLDATRAACRRSVHFFRCDTHRFSFVFGFDVPSHVSSAFDDKIF